jgi:uncharacterized protein (DUF169 family)
MGMNDNYALLAKTLADSLALGQPPIALCFTDAVPDGVERFKGRVPAGCRFWEDAATQGFATSSADHSLCAIGVHTHNLEPSATQQADLSDALRVFEQLGYVREQDLTLIPILQSRSQFVTYFPLAATPLPPDVVILFVKANQALLLSEATQQVESQSPPAMGRPACAVVPQVMNTGRAAMSLGCCGARAYLDLLADDVAIFAIPGPKLEMYAARIQALAGANAVLSRFHQIRRGDVQAGRSPSVQESLAAMELSEV